MAGLLYAGYMWGITVPADVRLFAAAVNHASFIDGLILVLCLPGPVCFAAGESSPRSASRARSCAGSVASWSTGASRRGRRPTPAASPPPCAAVAASRCGRRGRWTVPQVCGRSTSARSKPPRRPPAPPSSRSASRAAATWSARRAVPPAKRSPRRHRRPHQAIRHRLAGCPGHARPGPRGCPGPLRRARRGLAARSGPARATTRWLRPGGPSRGHRVGSDRSRRREEGR